MKLKSGTKLVQNGNEMDKSWEALNVPIYQASNLGI